MFPKIILRIEIQRQQKHIQYPYIHPWNYSAIT